MKFRSENFMEETKNQIRPYIKELKDGKKAEDIAKDIYCSLSEEKTEVIAKMMVEGMKEVIEKYHTDIEKCADDKASYIEERLKESTSNIEDAKERCKIYRNILVTIEAEAIRAEGGPDAEEKVKAYTEKAKNSEFSDETAEENEDELFRLAVEAVKNANILTMQLPQIVEFLENDNYEGAIGIMAYGRESADIKLIASMYTYVNATKGEYEDLRGDISMEEIVYNVCGAMDTCAIALQLQNGNIKEEAAKEVLEWIGVVLGMACLIAGSAWVYVSLMSVFTLPYLVSMFISIVIVYELNYFLAGYVMAASMLAVKTIGHGVIITTGFVKGVVVGGFKKLAQAVKPVVKPAIDWVRNNISGFFFKLAEIIRVKDDKKAPDDGDDDNHPDNATDGEKDSENNTAEPRRHYQPGNVPARG